MTFNSQEFGSPDGETALSVLERSELNREVARRREEAAHSRAAKEIAANPELTAMLATLIEGAGELSEQTKAHLRKMIAISYHLYGYTTEAVDAAREQQFYTLVIDTVQDELDELGELLDDGALPDLWDIAYEDLVRLEGGGL